MKKNEAADLQHWLYIMAENHILDVFDLSTEIANLTTSARAANADRPGRCRQFV